MEQEIAVWREGVERVGPRRGRRYTRELKEEALRLLQVAARRGIGQAEACRMLGLPESTLASWHGKKRGSTFVPIKLVEVQPRVEVRVGAASAELSMEQLADLVKRLS